MVLPRDGGARATLTIGVAQSVASRILYGMGKLTLFARLALVEAVVNLGLSLALVGPLGIVGVAIAVAVPNVLFCLFAITYACRVLQIGGRQYLFTRLAEAARCGVLAGVRLAGDHTRGSDVAEHRGRGARGVGAVRMRGSGN